MPAPDDGREPPGDLLPGVYADRAAGRVDWRGRDAAWLAEVTRRQPELDRARKERAATLAAEGKGRPCSRPPPDAEPALMERVTAAVAAMGGVRGRGRRKRAEPEPELEADAGA